MSARRGARDRAIQRGDVSREDLLARAPSFVRRRRPRGRGCDPSPHLRPHRVRVHLLLLLLLLRVELRLGLRRSLGERTRAGTGRQPRASALPARSEIALARSEATTGEKNIFPSSPIAHLLPSLSLFFSLRALDTAPRTRAPTRAPRSRPRLGRRASTPRSSRSGSRLPVKFLRKTVPTRVA